ncbi:hypothetical protein [Pseudomonas sp. CIP-10]|uniref:hypothetical protein n=1 Tax=Pseudomonas sp. CIP-10 TaxID=2892442 RepID=UPI001E3E928B|nr:hypothetical protein [Pseudomonas sp. CIP-10]UFH24793.1 hypothetical protein LMH93_14910 [Pseudomonas sp. CIP-10]
MTILFRPQGAFGWFSYTTSRDTIHCVGSRVGTSIDTRMGHAPSAAQKLISGNTRTCSLPGICLAIYQRLDICEDI